MKWSKRGKERRKVASNLIGRTIDRLKGFFSSIGQQESKPLFSQPPNPQYEPQQQQVQPSQSVQPVQQTPTTAPTPKLQATPTPPARIAADFGGFNASVPESYSPQIMSAATQNQIDPRLLAALLYQESKFNPFAVAGPTGNRDRGISQINEVAFPEISDEQALDPNFAIPFAAQNLRRNIDYFGGDINRGVAAYNVGRGGASIDGPEPFGGGPKGQEYIDALAQWLLPEVLNELGIKTKRKSSSN